MTPYIKQLLDTVKSEYEGNLQLANMCFDRYIETGFQDYKEKEYFYNGAAQAALRIKETIIADFEV